jgi:hypothetical protein
MESKVVRLAMHQTLLPAMLAALMFFAPDGIAQESAGKTTDETDTAEISLRKSIDVREYEGKPIEGDEREVHTGDTMWRILIREKGLAPDHFKEYFVLIRGLNPQLKTPEELRAGDKIFIPMKPDEALALQARSQLTQGAGKAPMAGQGNVQYYTVQPGEHLYRILRTRLGVLDETKLWQYFALVKDLNPEKSNWDILEKGETVRLPVVGGEDAKLAEAVKLQPAVKSAASGFEQKDQDPAKAETQVAMIPPASQSPTDSQVIGLDYARRLPARDNFALIATVVESLGNEVQRSGEEVVTMKDGTVRLDKNMFPVVYNRSLDQRVILDGENNIPDSLRANLKEKSVNTPVVSVAKNTTLQEAVGQLLERLGYQALATERPVIVREAGVSFEAKGQWAVTTPEESNKTQEIVVINLNDGAGEIPEYLKSHLDQIGLHLTNVMLRKPAAGEGNIAKPEPLAFHGQVRNLPEEKSEMVDALLQAYQIPFGVKEALSVELRGGLSVDVTADRICEYRGQKTAIFFHSIDPAVKAALEEKRDIKSIDLDVAVLNSRDLIGKLLAGLGEKAVYKDHRFTAAHGSMRDRLVMTAEGFFLSDRSLFVTDREIPPQFQPVFFEKGLDIVYFQ